ATQLRLSVRSRVSRGNSGSQSDPELPRFFVKIIVRMGRRPVLDSMDTISYPQKSESLAKLPRLTSSTLGGKPYVRSQAVEDEIQMVLRLHESEWIPAARNVKSET